MIVAPGKRIIFVEIKERGKQPIIQEYHVLCTSYYDNKLKTKHIQKENTEYFYNDFIMYSSILLKTCF